MRIFVGLFLILTLHLSSASTLGKGAEVYLLAAGIEHCNEQYPPLTDKLNSIFDVWVENHPQHKSAINDKRFENRKSQMKEFILHEQDDNVDYEAACNDLLIKMEDDINSGQ